MSILDQNIYTDPQNSKKQYKNLPLQMNYHLKQDGNKGDGKFNQFYQGQKQRIEQNLQKQQRMWNNSVGQNRIDNKRSQVLNFITSQKRMLKQRKIERLILQLKSEQNPMQVPQKVKNLSMSDQTIEQNFKFWQANMTRRQRMHGKEDSVLNSVNNHINKHLRSEVTKRILKMDETAINQISQKFLKQKALSNFHNDVVQQHRSYLRSKLLENHEKTFALEKSIGIIDKFKKMRQRRTRRKSCKLTPKRNVDQQLSPVMRKYQHAKTQQNYYRKTFGGGKSSFKKSPKKRKLVKKTQSDRQREIQAEGQNKTTHQISGDDQTPFNISFSDVAENENENNQLGESHISTPQFSQERRASLSGYSFKTKSKLNYRRSQFFDALATPKIRCDGYTMKTHPLNHKDFRGLYLSKIDERVLMQNSLKGERMFQKKLTYDIVMKRDQIVKPTTLSLVQHQYTPQYLNQYFKGRGTNSWKSKHKSKVRALRGSMASRDWSASQMAKHYKNSREKMTKEYKGNAFPKSPKAFKKSNQIDNLVYEMDKFDQRFQSEKHFKKRGYPKVQLETAKKTAERFIKNRQKQ